MSTKESLLPFAEAAEAMAVLISKGAPQFEGAAPSLDSETLKDLAPLVEINRLGLITHDSQPGQPSSETILDGNVSGIQEDLDWQEKQLALATEEGDESAVRDYTEYIEYSKQKIERIKSLAGQYSSTRERAYLCGLMKPEAGHRFIHWMNTYTDKKAFSPTLLGNSNEQSYDSILVTEFLVGPTKETATEPDWSPQTTLLLSITPVMMEETRHGTGVKDDISSLLYVNVYDPVFGRRDTSPDGLYADVLRGLRESASSVAKGGGKTRRKQNRKTRRRRQ